VARTNEVQVLPEALRAWRNERKWSQKELADRTRVIDGSERLVSPTLIAMIETGERQPSLSNGLAIARALGVSLLALATCSPEIESMIRTAERPVAAV
jgi:transcriptional regulator with XRE-family HTH domain